LGTVEGERMFSLMNLVKTRLRINLSQRALNELLRINHDGKEEFTDADYDDLLKRFAELSPGMRLELGM